jgi:hypothetical protein
LCAAGHYIAKQIALDTEVVLVFNFRHLGACMSALLLSYSTECFKVTVSCRFGLEMHIVLTFF